MTTFDFCGWTITSDFSELKFFTSDNELLIRSTEDKITILCASFTDDFFQIIELESYFIEVKIYSSQKRITLTKTQHPDELEISESFTMGSEF